MSRLYSHPREYRRIYLANYLCIGFVPGGYCPKSTYSKLLRIVRGFLGADPLDLTLESASPSPPQGSIWHRNRVKSGNRCRINVESMPKRCQIDPWGGEGEADSRVRSEGSVPKKPLTNSGFLNNSVLQNLQTSFVRHSVKTLSFPWGCGVARPLQNYAKKTSQETYLEIMICQGGHDNTQVDPTIWDVLHLEANSIFSNSDSETTCDLPPQPLEQPKRLSTLITPTPSKQVYLLVGKRLCGLVANFLGRLMSESRLGNHDLKSNAASDCFQPPKTLCRPHCLRLPLWTTPSHSQEPLLSSSSYLLPSFLVPSSPILACHSWDIFHLSHSWSNVPVLFFSVCIVLYVLTK